MSTATERAGAPPGRPAMQLLGAAVGGAALLTPLAVHGQPDGLELSLESQLIATNNAGQVAGPGARSDLLLDLRPRARLRSLGAGLRADVRVGAIARSYLQGTQPNRVEPDVEAQARAEVVEGWVALDGSVRVSAAAADPLSGRTESSTDIAPGTFRQSRVALAPRLQRDLSPHWTLQAHTEHVWQRSDDPNASAGTREPTRTEDTLARLERRPQPAGLSAEVRRQRQKNDAAPRGGTVLAIDAVRVGASYRVLPQLVAGLHGGTERSVYLGRDDDDRIAGASLDWQPGERVRVRGATERRFFGQAFDASLAYRSPYLAVSGSWTRQAGLAGSTLGAGAAGSDVAQLLDNLLTTRVPNPVERAELVDRLMRERGLPATLSRATEIVDQTPQLVTNGALSLVLMGVRHTLALGLYARTARELTREGEAPLGIGGTDVRQRGAQAVFNRRLTPTMTLGLAVERATSRGLGTAAGDVLREWQARADLGVALGSRTRATFGLSRQLVKSTRAGNRAESRALLGLVQNF